MDMVAAIKLNGSFHFFEAHYLFFVLDLDSRMDEKGESCRPGLGVVTKRNAEKYVEFMREFAVDEKEIKCDFDSLGVDDLRDARFDFLPTVLIDFDCETFFSSHPEDHYLNFEGYLPPHWKYEHVDDVPLMIPVADAYWASWNRLNETS